eukprot:CAMPEP_0173391778 /NCGR_PEP_ID=MMETSP1356-20130122/18577_1 /TAXON_ID=77927 ORGANISM="Hemiselmis virescens, Strain PCC157" /NCGR_SAMPLE_ID=MMETSP1356 /ASSEMBLY_ACC=CAM_ASM_000847 /LENGTH=427 /DNA_ID=CAMNT_0014349467 /DNA_START=15 /DNA_END=1299 /DNA_ORIENTATION=-
MYDKEQSRRVPAVRAKPGNPGYGFRRARWRETLAPSEDRRICETILRTLGVNQERLERIKRRIHDFKVNWDAVRRPSRPAGPGRPRGHKRAPGETAAELAPPYSPVSGQTKKSKKGCVRGTGSQEAQAAIALAVEHEHELFNGPVPLPALVVGGVWGMHEEDEKSHMRTATTQNSTSWQKGQNQAADMTKAGSAGGAPPVEVSMAEENSSLRSLNLSLIYEREALVRQVSDTERDLADTQRQFEELIATHSHGSARDHVAAFVAMAARVNSPSGAGVIDLTQQHIGLLEEAFDSFDQYTNRPKRPSRGGVGAASHAVDQDGFFELHVAEVLPSCDDLRELLQSLHGETGQRAPSCSSSACTQPSSHNDPFTVTSSVCSELSAPWKARENTAWWGRGRSAAAMDGAATTFHLTRLLASASELSPSSWG